MGHNKPTINLWWQHYVGGPDNLIDSPSLDFTSLHDFNRSNNIIQRFHCVVLCILGGDDVDYFISSLHILLAAIPNIYALLWADIT